MAWSPLRIISFTIPLALAVFSGCASERAGRQEQQAVVSHSELEPLPSTSDSFVVQSSHHDVIVTAEDVSAETVPAPLPIRSLENLEQLALDQNSDLARLFREYQAAAARSHHIGKLPDPRFGANVFGQPIETASGSQRATMSVSQMIPWLGKLNAEEQRASLEALAIRAEYESERLKVLTGVRAGWYRLYVIDHQIEIAEANQKLLKSLIDVANARISTGAASQGDVLLGTLELSQLEERLYTYRRQRTAVQAELNRLMARPSNIPIDAPTQVDVDVPQLTAESIFQIALNNQPEFEATRLRIQATSWGVEVARLSCRPEVTLSANYFVTDDNRPPSTIVDVGADPWSMGVQVSVPLWHKKYNAIRDEAGWRHMASHDSLDTLFQRYDAAILDILAEIRRAEDTANLYEKTILPQARQTLKADQQAYTTGKVEFDRVIRDYRNLLTLEVGYHQAIGDLATATARLQQLMGLDALPMTGEFAPPCID